MMKTQQVETANIEKKNPVQRQLCSKQKAVGRLVMQAISVYRDDLRIYGV